MPRRLASGLIVALLLLSACSSSKPKPAAQGEQPVTTVAGLTEEPLAETVPATTVPAYPVFTVATAHSNVRSVEVFDTPAEGTAAKRVANPHPYYVTPRVFLVQEERGDFLNVLLPIRPNGSTGWIRRADVDLAHHDYRMQVELGARQVTVWERNEVILQAPVAVGTGSTPTPQGLFYTTELLIPDGQPAYGPYAYGLSGYSEVLFDFAGGDGQFGLHGTNDPSSIGRNISNGCIRLANANITMLAERLPIGVPIEIKA